MSRARDGHPRNGPGARLGRANDWRARAACRGMTPDLFFSPTNGESREERIAREASAKAVCTACPVNAECLEHAIVHGERYGIWGGTTPVERRRVAARAYRVAG